jgi:uncharacterized membrane protein
MNRMLVTVFDDQSKAYEAAGTFKSLHADGSISLYSIALVVQSRQGKVLFKHLPGEELQPGILGIATSSLAGLLGAPAGIAARAAAGTLAESLMDLFNAGVSPDFLSQVSKQMAPGKAAVIAEIDEDGVMALDACLEGLGGDIFRSARSGLEETLLERDIAAFRADVASLKAESTHSSSDTKAKIRALIGTVEAELQAIQIRASMKAQELKCEAETKIKSVQNQAAGARDDVKAKLERRIADVRADYEARSKKLNQAERLAQAALAA